MVREIWFEKSGSRKVVDQKKGWFYSINPPFLWFEKSGWPEKKIRVCRTTFLEPLFYTFLEKWLQNKWSNVWQLSSMTLSISNWSSRPKPNYLKTKKAEYYHLWLPLLSLAKQHFLFLPQRSQKLSEMAFRIIHWYTFSRFLGMFFNIK